MAIHCPDLDLTEGTSPNTRCLAKGSFIGAWKPFTDCKMGTCRFSVGLYLLSFPPARGLPDSG